MVIYVDSANDAFKKRPKKSVIPIENTLIIDFLYKTENHFSPYPHEINLYTVQGSKSQCLVNCGESCNKQPAFGRLKVCKPKAAVQGQGAMQNAMHMVQYAESIIKLVNNGIPLKKPLVLPCSHDYSNVRGGGKLRSNFPTERE
jgi:hypothetical protein